MNPLQLLLQFAPNIINAIKGKDVNLDDTIKQVAKSTLGTDNIANAFSLLSNNSEKQQQFMLEMEKQAIEKHNIDIEFLTESNKNQTEINKEYAKKNGIFMAGGRPALIWLCVIAFGYTFLFQPLLAWISINIGWQPPSIPNEHLVYGLITSLMGLSGIRSYDKTKNNHLK